MNFFILIMLFLCLIGLLDKALNNRLGLVESFDKGINSMGSKIGRASCRERVFEGV